MNESVRTCAIRIRPARISTASPSAASIWVICDVSIMWRRSRRSAKTPPITREEQKRELAEKGVQTDEERGTGPRHGHNQPCLRDLLHPSAAARRKSPDPEQPEVAMCQRYGRSMDEALEVIPAKVTGPESESAGNRRQ
jgi:hypothetical protein